MYTLITTAKLNDVDPQAWLADVLARIADLPYVAAARASTLGVAAGRWIDRRLTFCLLPFKALVNPSVPRPSPEGYATTTAGMRDPGPARARQHHGALRPGRHHHEPARPARVAHRGQAATGGLTWRPCAARGWRSPTSLIVRGPLGAGQYGA